jgi:hypothetical protein
LTTVTLAVIGLFSGAGAGDGADCAKAPPAKAEMASTHVVFLNMLIKTPIFLVE